jgi:hypothetical protein
MVLEVTEEIMIWIGIIKSDTKIQKFAELFHKLNPDVFIDM